MAIPQLKSEPKITIEEYLVREREAEERSEYFDGIVIRMSGESPSHADISFNLAGLLGPQLRGTSCRARIKDTKVRSGPAKPFSRYNSKGMFSYPDLVVICDDVEYYDDHRDIVTNPKAIFEVLSPSTERFDREIKFKRYLTWNSTLSDYILISQDEPSVERYRRTVGGEWNYSFVEGLNAEVIIESIRCTIKLADLYERVEFPPDDAEEKSEG